FEVLPVSFLKVSCGEVVHDGVAEDMLVSPRGWDVLALSPDDDGQLPLVVKPRRLRRHGNPGAGTHHRGGHLREEDRMTGRLGTSFRRVVGVVLTHAEDVLPRPRDRSEERRFRVRTSAE